MDAAVQQEPPLARELHLAARCLHAPAGARGWLPRRRSTTRWTTSFGSGSRPRRSFGRIDKVLAIDRHQAQRKVYQWPEQADEEVLRLAEMYGIPPTVPFECRSRRIGLPLARRADGVPAPPGPKGL